MPKTVRVGLIGFGNMGRIHAENLNGRVHGAKLVAVADPREDMADARNIAAGPVPFYHDYRFLLEKDDIDAFVVAAATTRHADILRSLVEGGHPVLCEKPIALTSADSLAIHKLYEERGVPLQIGFMRRYDPQYIKAKQLIDEGKIGQPYHFYGVSRDRVGPAYEVARYSGGFFLDTGVHDFDLAHWLLDTQIDSVFARGDIFRHEDYKNIPDVDQAHASFHCVSKALGLVELSRDAIYGYEIRTEILGTKGAIQVSALHSTGTVLLVDGEVVRDTYADYRERFDQAYLNELQDFVNRVSQGESVAVTAVDGIRATLVGEAAARSLTSGRDEVVETALLPRNPRQSSRVPTPTSNGRPD
jgi:predicted dehydrogenase